MAASGPPLSSEGIHALDQLRQRLSQMSTSIGSLKADLERPDVLPTWSSLQSSAQILSHNLSQLMATFDTHRDFLTASHAYPLTNFPGLTKEPLLNELLRKRLEPRTEEWLKKHENPYQEREQTSSGGAELLQLWEHAGQQSRSIVHGMAEDGAFDDDFTIAEREMGIETVSTGLRRDLAHGESDAEDADRVMSDSKADADTKDPVSQTPVLLESMLKVMSTGIIARQ